MASAVEIDDQYFAVVACVAHDEIADVEVGVPSAGVVEGADGARGGCGCAQAFASRGSGCQERGTVGRVFLVHRALGAAPQESVPVSQHEGGPGHGGAVGAQCCRDLALGAYVPTWQIIYPAFK